MAAKSSPKIEHKKEWLVFPLLILSVIALLSGMWAGLLRLGWILPGGSGPLPVSHGPLMVSGFLGTLIALERVVALRQRWMFIGPLFSGMGWLASLLVPSQPLGPVLITLGSLILLVIFTVIIRREPRIFTFTMGVGALSWLVGNLLWLSGKPVFTIVLWWAAFLVFTIAGERLELSRVLRPKQWHYLLFSAAALVFLAGVILSTWMLDTGTRLAGLGMILTAAWLIRFDIARRNLRHKLPLTRYIAACLFAGYIWLGISGGIALLAGGQIGGGLYDALLHAVFVGFVISMIFGHAPIIIPAVTGALVKFSPRFYAHLLLLHISLVLRIAGDLLGQPAWRKWGGLFNEIAIILFLISIVWMVVQGRGKTI